MKRALLIEQNAAIRRMATAALKNGGWEVAVADEGNAAQEGAAKAPSLILLDANDKAPSLAQTLRAVPELQKTPIIVMVSDRDAERWMARTGAVDAIRKPFSPGALRTIATHVLESPRVPAVVHSSFPPPVVESGVERALLDAQEALEGDLDRAGYLEVARVVGEAYDQALGIGFRGRLEHLGLGDVMQMLAQGHSGILHVRRNARRGIQVCYRRGHIAFVRATGLGEDDRLGRYFVRHGTATHDDVEHAAILSGWIGQTLLGEGRIDEPQHNAALTAQSSERVYDALRWTRGAFYFEGGATLPEADADLSLPATGLLMEGLRRIDEWRLIETELTHFGKVYARDDSRRSKLGTLSPVETRVFEAVDGVRSVEELIEATGLGSFEACKALYQFARVGAITSA